MNHLLISRHNIQLVILNIRYPHPLQSELRPVPSSPQREYLQALLRSIYTILDTPGCICYKTLNSWLWRRKKEGIVVRGNISNAKGDMWRLI